MMPPPDAMQPMPLDRKAGLAAKDVLETPGEARVRKARGGPAPAHYVPPEPLGTAAAGERVESPYKKD
jgi:hypothetical protein